jgi:hypothetical protein
MIRLICEPEDGNNALRVEFELSPAMDLDDVIEHVENFLKAAGYYFPEGTILGYEQVNKD